ncbi:hypothetical protein GOV13_04420 [Candidatus Pacearchaeota archaeon]|nr:hypothetical protein [Candidatus Pacearchaeota archaeon]
MESTLWIDYHGEKGDKKKPWGYSMGVGMTPITGFVEANFIFNHWTFKVHGGSRNYEGLAIEGIVCGHKIDEADKEMHRLMESELVNRTVSDLGLKHIKIEIDDRTSHAKSKKE